MSLKAVSQPVCDFSGTGSESDCGPTDFVFVCVLSTHHRAWPRQHWWLGELQLRSEERQAVHPSVVTPRLSPGVRLSYCVQRVQGSDHGSSCQVLSGERLPRKAISLQSLLGPPRSARVLHT